VDAVDLVQAEALTGMNLMDMTLMDMAQPRLGDCAAANKWHFLKGPDGTPLVCLESLLKAM